MAYYAFLDENNTVTEVITGRNENEVVDGITDWEAYYSEVRGQVCKRTSFNTYGNTHANGGTPFRYNYAGIGWTFDSTKGTDGAFIGPKRFESWHLDESTCLWAAPVPYPTDGKVYDWNESTLGWDKAPE